MLNSILKSKVIAKHKRKHEHLSDLMLFRDKISHLNESHVLKM